MILGCANLIDCRPLSFEELAANVDKHCIEDLQIVTYRKIYAWVFSAPVRYRPPLHYKHHPGAITWIKLGKARQRLMAEGEEED